MNTDVNTETPDTMSAAQARAAHQMARAYGHLWATIVGDDETDIDVIRERVISWVQENYPDGGMVGGIYAPEMDKDNYVVHTTGSGRVHWEIDNAGVVTISIHRPRGPHDGGECGICGARVLPWAEWDGNSPRVQVWAATRDDTEWWSPVPVFRRHWIALAQAIAATGAEWEEVKPGTLDVSGRRRELESLGILARRQDPVREQMAQALKKSHVGPNEFWEEGSREETFAEVFDQMRRVLPSFAPIPKDACPWTWNPFSSCEMPNASLED